MWRETLREQTTARAVTMDIILVLLLSLSWGACGDVDKPLDTHLPRESVDMTSDISKDTMLADDSVPAGPAQFKDPNDFLVGAPPGGKSTHVRVSHSGSFPPKFLVISPEKAPPNPLEPPPEEDTVRVKGRQGGRRKGRRKGRRGGSGRREEAVPLRRMEYLQQQWCKTERIKQVIHKKGCNKVTILNNFCYGQCNSFFVPQRHIRGGGDSAAFKSCAFCRPRSSKVITVTLTCPRRAGKLFRKRVEVVKECRCMALRLE